jgi:hypothetical protein
MINLIRSLTIGAAILLLAYLGYEAFGHDSARHWLHFKKPEEASFTSLAQDESILQELDNQTRYGTYKPIDPFSLDKPNIFQTIER